MILLIFILSSFTVHKLLASNEPILAVKTAKADIVQQNNDPSSNSKLEAYESANIVSKTAGKVGEIKVDLGSTVKTGDVLLTLEANELQASIAQAQAAIQLANSNRELAQIDYQTQKANYNQNKLLVESGALSQYEFDNKISLPFKKAEELALHGVEAQVQQAEANLQLANANYANSILTSPINGIVTARNINIGELASPSVSLFSLANLDKVIAMASLGESEINKIKTGVKIPILIEAVSDQPFDGLVTNIAQAANPTSKAYLVKIQIDNPDHRLKPGMFAEVLWNNARKSDLFIPLGALVSENGESYVWTVINGIVSKKKVLTAALDGTKAIIKEGLSVGQEVVVSDQNLLKEGMLVTVVHQ